MTESNISNLVEKPPQARKPREYAGRKSRLRYNSESLSVDVPIRYAPAISESIFKPEGIRKTGPNGGDLRWERGKEWKVFEIDGVTGKEQEIRADEVKYFQETEEGQIEVEPFDSTQIIDIKDGRALNECNLDGPVTLGSVIPDNMEDNFGNDKEKGTKIYEIWAEQSSTGLWQLLEKLEKEKLKLFFPFVFRKGMSVHLCVAKIVRLNGDVYMLMKTYAGPLVYKHAIKSTEGEAEKEVIKPLLAKPILRRKPIGVA